MKTNTKTIYRDTLFEDGILKNIYQLMVFVLFLENLLRTETIIKS